MFAPVANILQESGAGILDLVEHCGADIDPLEKARRAGLVRFKTTVSTSTITTRQPTLWTKLCRKNWRKILLWWRWSRMRWPIWKGHCPVSDPACAPKVRIQLRAWANAQMRFYTNKR